MNVFPGSPSHRTLFDPFNPRGSRSGMARSGELHLSRFPTGQGRIVKEGEGVAVLSDLDTLVLCGRSRVKLLKKEALNPAHYDMRSSNLWMEIASEIFGQIQKSNHCRRMVVWWVDLVLAVIGVDDAITLSKLRLYKDLVFRMQSSSMGSRLNYIMNVGLIQEGIADAVRSLAESIPK